MLEFKKQEERFVDAIENGKIVKVSEDYARREGLLILRKSSQLSIQPAPISKKEEEAKKSRSFIGMEDLRKPLSTKDNGLLRELVENFHWILVRKRKDRLLTRKKVADDIGEDELSVKIIENGVLPANNFILLNKLENYYGISLRKNRVVATAPKPPEGVIDFNKSQNSQPASVEAPEVVEVRVARTPKWVLKRENRDKKEEPEIEIIEEESEILSNDKASDSLARGTGSDTEKS